VKFVKLLFQVRFFNLASFTYDGSTCYIFENIFEYEPDKNYLILESIDDVYDGETQFICFLFPPEGKKVSIVFKINLGKWQERNYN
jgi:hypothetical protein